MVKTIAILCFIMTVLNLPIYYLLMQNAIKPLDSHRFFAYFTVGVFASSSFGCDYKTLEGVPLCGEENELEEIDMKLECPIGSKIMEVNDLGFFNSHDVLRMGRIDPK